MPAVSSYGDGVSPRPGPDELLCLEALRGVDRHWFQAETAKRECEEVVRTERELFGEDLQVR